MVDHIATCSPCFDVYTVYRKKYRARHNWKRSVAVIVLLAVLAVAWYFGRQASSGSTSLPADRGGHALTAVLDFHDRTAERSDQVQAPRPSPIPHLRRSLLNLQIRLPIGTEDGAVFDRVPRERLAKLPFKQPEPAKWDGTTETLSMPGSICEHSSPVNTRWLFAKGASSWRQYSVFVD